MNERVKNVSGIIIKTLLITGAVAIVATSPYAARGVWKYLKYAVNKSRREKERKIKEEQWKNSFYYLKRRGFIKMEYIGRQLYVSLTEEGKKIAKKCKYDELEIKKPKKWDKKWRILIFDIANEHRIKREALRGKIKELGLFQLQKSVWIYPYDFEKEMYVLKEFFRFKASEFAIITADKISNEKLLKGRFQLQ